MSLENIIVIHDESDGSTSVINLDYVSVITQETNRWRIYLDTPESKTVPVDKQQMNKILKLIEARQQEPQT